MEQFYSRIKRVLALALSPVSTWSGKVQKAITTIVILAPTAASYFAKIPVLHGIYLSALIFMATLFVATYKLQSELDHANTPQLVISDPIEQSWGTQRGAGTSYWLDITNTSLTKTIRGVSAKLLKITPEQKGMTWLPIFLHIKHDNEAPYDTHFSLHPGDHRGIDLVSAPDDKAADIVHIVSGVSCTLPFGDKQHFNLTVLVVAEDVKPVTKTFEIWWELGVLQCRAI